MPPPRARSVRELRRALPDNVAILPTAASRQVAQPANKAGREAMRAARAGHAARFGFKPPSYREAERRAEAMQSADAGALLALAILAALDLETRREVAARLGTMAGHGRAYQQAADLAAASALNAGESMDIARALAVLASRAEP